ncbi:hypothetical protein GCK32_018526, partial [Trichostrongylus colubriformis]
ANKPTPKFAIKPVSCKKCNKEIPAGRPFYVVNNAPKCTDCCITDGIKEAPKTAARPNDGTRAGAKVSSKPVGIISSMYFIAQYQQSAITNIPISGVMS